MVRVTIVTAKHNRVARGMRVVSEILPGTEAFEAHAYRLSASVDDQTDPENDDA